MFLDSGGNFVPDRAKISFPHQPEEGLFPYDKFSATVTFTKQNRWFIKFNSTGIWGFADRTTFWSRINFHICHGSLPFGL